MNCSQTCSIAGALSFCYRMLYMLYDSWVSAGTFLASVLAGQLHSILRHSRFQPQRRQSSQANGSSSHVSRSLKSMLG